MLFYFFEVTVEENVKRLVSKLYDVITTSILRRINSIEIFIHSVMNFFVKQVAIYSSTDVDLQPKLLFE